MQCLMSFQHCLGFLKERHMNMMLWTFDLSKCRPAERLLPQMRFVARLGRPRR